MKNEKYSIEIEDNTWIKERPYFSWRLVTFWAHVESYRTYKTMSAARRGARRFASLHKIEIQGEIKL